MYFDRDSVGKLDCNAYQIKNVQFGMCFVEVLKAKLHEIHTKMKNCNLVCKTVVIFGEESSVNTYQSLYVKKGMYLCADFFETQFKIHTKLQKCNLVCIFVEVLKAKLPEIHTKL